MTTRQTSRAALAAMLALIAAPALADPAPATNSRPMAVPLAKTIPDAADAPYPGGPVTLAIDATDTQRAVLRVTETVPVAPDGSGDTHDLVLQLPRWLPGDHAPTGLIQQIADLHFLVDGKPVTWHRDPVQIFAFHVDVPAGAAAVVAKFVVTAPLTEAEGRITITPDMMNLEWTAMSLYPAGYYVRDITVQPSVTLPHGWSIATALDGVTQSGDTTSWAPVSYDTLIDSPIFAGVNFHRYDLGGKVALDVFADKPGQAELTPDHLAAYKALVPESFAAFGSHHFDHYDFLVGLTNQVGGVGLEHHRSSENTMSPNAFAKWDDYDWDRNVLAHEFAHSWNGKFRRPDRLWTAEQDTPMQDNLLWVYEGQTQFWGLVLAVRSGVQTKAMVLGEMAGYAGDFAQEAGRAWRSVEDTTHDEIMDGRHPKPFPSLSRTEDYYTEGALVWLEADQIIRAGTGGKKGLDDFAKAFFGIRDGDWGEVTYDFDGVVAALNGVYPYDWAGFLRARISNPGQPAPLAGIEKAGYHLVWKDTPNPYEKAVGDERKWLTLGYGLGITIAKDGAVVGARWDSAAANAGVVVGAKILAVNGRTYDEDDLKAAVTAAKGTDKPITLLIQRGAHVETVTIAYHDGLRWPWLEPANTGTTGLDKLLSPRRPQSK